MTTIKERIERLKAGLMETRAIIASGEYHNRGLIPKSLTNDSAQKLVEEYCLNHDWIYYGSINWDQSRSALIDVLKFRLKPLSFKHYWTIPEQYQEGRDIEYTECLLIRGNYLTYTLTNALLGSMAAQEVRIHYAIHKLEWRRFHNYQAEIEAGLAKSGLVLIKAI